MGKTTDELGGYAGENDGEVTSDIEMTRVEPLRTSAGYERYSGGTADLGSAETIDGLRTPPDDGGGDIDGTVQQIEETRTQMSRTIDAIQQKLSPENLVQEAKSTVHDATVGKAQDMVSNAADAATGVVSDVGDGAMSIGETIIETIRQNPVPAALAGIGLGWLFYSSRSAGSSSRQSSNGGYGPRGYQPRTGYSQSPQAYGSSYGTGQGQSGASITDKAQQAAGSVAGTVTDTASQAANTAGQLASQVTDTASQAAGTAGQVASQATDVATQYAQQATDTAAQYAQQAQYQAQSAGRSMINTVRQNPLAASAVALTAGLAVGLAIPETQVESQWMGDARQTVMQRAQQTVQDTTQKVQAVAQETVSAARDAAQHAAQDEGLTKS